MKRAVRISVLLLISQLALNACSDASSSSKPLSEPSEKLYEMTGAILSRDAEDNTLNVAHDAIPGFMEAMTMDYSVRGVKVTELGPDRSRIRASLHVTDRGYWLTDVKQVP